MDIKYYNDRGSLFKIIDDKEAWFYSWAAGWVPIENISGAKVTLSGIILDMYSSASTVIIRNREAINEILEYLSKDR